MQVGSGDGHTTVGINGAPAWVYTGAGRPARRVVVPERRRDLAGRTTRSADTRVSARSSATGLYRAPATVPDGGKVRITATSDDGAFDAVEITIVKRPTPTPKPDVPDPGRRPRRPTTRPLR